MHSYKTILFFTMKRLIPFLLLFSLNVAQNIPILMDNPVYEFLNKQESQGNISGEYWSTRPYTLSQINNMLTEIENHSSALSGNELSILKRFQIEFNREITNEGITLPWSKSNLAGLRHPNDQEFKPFFMTYKQDQTSGWISWSETFRIQRNGDGSRGYHTDFLGISGEKGSISFTTEYTFHRVTRSSAFDQLPDSYKEGYILDRDYIKWINWGYPTSSLTYTHPDFTLGIHRQPIYWGYSANNSPILSDNVNPLPYVQWTTETSHLRFKFIHARLSPNDAPVADTLNIRRNLSAHRVEFDINPNFEFAFSEMVVYAYRDFELGYLNPVNFLFAEEQASGDLDNKLMALDFKWRALPGLTTYGTWFFDELDFWKLFSGWWGNKFVFQLGATFYPTANLPSISLEYTAARPWTYSHKNPINSFTSVGRLLGFAPGPNTALLSLHSNWQMNSKLSINGRVKWLIQYDGIGSEVLDPYHYVEQEENPSEGFWNGDATSITSYSLIVEYEFSSVLNFGLVMLKDREQTTTIQTQFNF
ncbi:MAG: hypothetical protein HQ508_07875 [Candidatus Marinimicrobia bacterium]|nr:hypothetical protein [Candidatus Neomarinimicrobiota bacterium]